MKKGRHRRFEEARKLKQAGPEAFGGLGPRTPGSSRQTEEDEYAAIAKRYGAFDDEEVEDEDDDQ